MEGNFLESSHHVFSFSRKLTFEKEIKRNDLLLLEKSQKDPINAVLNIDNTGTLNLSDVVKKLRDSFHYFLFSNFFPVSRKNLFVSKAKQSR